MFDIIAFLLIILFVPTMAFVGIKMYKPSTHKLIQILTWVLLGCELVRFFYNARFYEKAVAPSSDLTLTYLSIMCALALFSTYNKGKIGTISQSLFVLSSLSPLVLALFDSSLYVSALDTHAVLKALYFVETGLVITLALLYVFTEKEKPAKPTTKQLVTAIIVLGLYIGLNAFARFAFESGDFTVLWGISMVAMLACAALVYLGLWLLTKKRKKLASNPSAIKQD